MHNTQLRNGGAGLESRKLELFALHCSHHAWHIVHAPRIVALSLPAGANVHPTGGSEVYNLKLHWLHLSLWR